MGEALIYSVCRHTDAWRQTVCETSHLCEVSFLIDLKRGFIYEIFSYINTIFNKIIYIEMFFCWNFWFQQKLFHLINCFLA